MSEGVDLNAEGFYVGEAAAPRLQTAKGGFVSSAGARYEVQTDSSGNLLIAGYQDVWAILEANQAMLTENSGYTHDKTFRRVASIPLLLRNKIMIEEGWDPYRPDLYPERYRRLLNDPDFRKLRTAPGRI